MQYLVPVLVAFGLAVAPGLAMAQDTNGPTPSTVEKKVSSTDKSKDIAASKADANARAHNASKLSGKNSNETKATGGSSRAKSFNENDNTLKNDADNKLKSDIDNKLKNANRNDNTLKNDNTLRNDVTVKNHNHIKIGDINNTNYNDNKQNVTIGVPVVPVKR